LQEALAKGKVPVEPNQKRLSIISALNIIDDPAIWTQIQAA
jgi:hypothetical protein